MGNISAEQSHQSDSEERQQLFLKLSEIGGKTAVFEIILDWRSQWNPMAVKLKQEREIKPGVEKTRLSIFKLTTQGFLNIQSTIGKF